MSGLLGYDPQRLATLARSAQTAADELAAAASDEPFAADAVDIAHAIAASLDDTLIESLRAVLADTSMTAWGASGPAPGTYTAAPGASPGVVPWWLTVDQLIAALDGQAAAVAVPATPSADGFTLAASITAAEPLQWFHDVNAGCVSYAGGSYSGGGYVTAPDGQRYPIVVPRVETDDGDVYTADVHEVTSGEVSVATLAGSDPGWEVVACETGIERVQAEPSGWELVAGFLAGTTGVVRPMPPNTALASIAMPVGAAPYLSTAPVAPGPVVAPSGSGVVDPTTSSAATTITGTVGLGTTAAQGVVMVAGMDNQSERAYQVIFEENADGRRRARVQTFRLGYDTDGEVFIIPEHLYVNGDGELTAQTISYGSLDGTSGSAVSSTDDVVPTSLSGDEPFTYPVPAAVFP